MKAYRLLIIQIFNENNSIKKWLTEFKYLYPVSEQDKLKIAKELKQAFYRRINLGSIYILGKYYEDSAMYLICSDRRILDSNICFLEVFREDEYKVFNLIDKTTGEIRQARIIGE